MDLVRSRRGLWGDIVALTELIAAGADVDARDPRAGFTPPLSAAGRGDITRLLVLQPGVGLGFQGATNGYLPLHDALWHGFEKCAAVLLDVGAPPDGVGHDGYTPLRLSIDVFGVDHVLTPRIERLGARTSASASA